ncbi:MAG: hypothetical protein SGPRY_002004 [Prymnesium sp.]
MNTDCWRSHGVFTQATEAPADIKRNPVSKKLVVPLCFFFTKQPPSYFPVNAIAGCNDIRISVKFRTRNELMIIHTSRTGSSAWRNHNATVTIPHELVSATEAPKIKRRLFDMELPFLHPVLEMIVLIRKTSEMGNSIEHTAKPILMPMLHSNSATNFTHVNETGASKDFDAQALSELLDRKEIYVYSFALNPENPNPNGAANFSRASQKRMTIEGYAHRRREHRRKDGRALLSFTYLIAIDVGFINLGLCIFDVRSKKIVLWDCVNLADKYMPSKPVKCILQFVKRYEFYFKDAKKVLIEKQMRCNMRIIESVLHALFYDICIVILPRFVIMHYKLSGKDYREIKQVQSSALDAQLHAALHGGLCGEQMKYCDEMSTDDEDIGTMQNSRIQAELQELFRSFYTFARYVYSHIHPDEAENQYQVVKKPQMASRAPKSEVYEVTRALSSTATSGATVRLSAVVVCTAERITCSTIAAFRELIKVLRGMPLPAASGILCCHMMLLMTPTAVALPPQKELMERAEARKAASKGSKEGSKKAKKRAGSSSAVREAAPTAEALPEIAGSTSKQSAPTVKDSKASRSKASEAGKRGREWEDVIAQKAASSSAYKSLFLSESDKKRLNESTAANLCARGTTPRYSS